MHPMLVLFAQKAFKGPPGPPPELVGGIIIAWGAIICVSVVVGLIALTLAILHLIAEYKTLSLIKKRNRTMEPGMIFLIFIPFFGIIWNIFVVLRLAESLRNEFEDRGWDTDGENFGYGMGLTMAILNILGGCGGVSLIFLIIHWRQISGYHMRLAGLGRGSRR
jgi:hypothetical protein